MAKAPFCNIAPPVPGGDPSSPTGFEIIPAGATVPQIITILNRNFKKMSPSSTPPAIPPSNGRSSNTQGNFQEVRSARITATVRVFNPSDSSQFVDVEQINALTFKDSKTGETITWNR